MKRINKLSSYIYNRIAAGEVVERPSSVVKELVENSIDADATELSIHISGGGGEKIIVTDNGSGIHPDDFELAFSPHATSKISSVEDLDDILTLGFRGEALASIASVSKVTLKSRVADNEIAFIATFDGITMTKNIPSSGNIGTQITVNSLFYNTPARAKYMKKTKSEEQAITLLVTKLMLANPFARINYYADDKLQLASSGNGLESVIKSVYTKDIYNEILDVDYEIGNYKLKGFILPPTVTRHNKNMQTVTVNGRIIANNNISAAINRGYGERLFTGQHAIYILNLTLKNREVDINVTPSKTDARFFDADKLFSIFYHAVRNRLSKYEEDKILRIANELRGSTSGGEGKNTFARDVMSNSVDKNNGSNENLTRNFGAHDSDIVRNRGNYNDSSNGFIDKQGANQKDVYLCEDTKKQIEALQSLYAGESISGVAESSNLLKIIARDRQENYKNDIYGKAENTGEIKKTADKNSENLTFAETVQDENTRRTLCGYDLNVIGTCFNTYLLVATEQKLFFVDIHAANERMLYDSLLKGLEKGKINIQPYLIPQIIDLDFDDFNYIKSLFPNLIELGFDIEIFGDCTIKINAVPQLLTDINIDSFINELAQNKTLKLSTSEIIKEKLSLFACKNSIKAGTALSAEQAQLMAEKIFLTKNVPLTCPHGRPIIIEMTKSEIERKFRR